MRHGMFKLVFCLLGCLAGGAGQAAPVLVNPAIGTLQVLATDHSALAGVNALAFDGFGNLFATRQVASLSDGLTWVNKSSGAAVSLASNLPGADHMVFTPDGHMLLTAEAPATFTAGPFTFATPNLFRLTVSYDASLQPSAAAATNLVTAPTRLNFPEGLVLLDGSNAYGAAGDLLVAEDRTGGRILRVTPGASTASVAELVPAATGLARPEGLAFGDFGGAVSAGLYAATTSTGRIVRIGADGSVTPVGAAGVLNGPDNLVFGPDGRLYIGEDPQNSNPARLFALAADGTFELIAEGFTTLQGLAFDPANGDLYIAEQSTDTIWRLSFTPAQVPVPGSAWLVGAGLIAFGRRRRGVEPHPHGARGSRPHTTAMTDARSDEALMLAYRDGDGAAFEVLFARWRSRLFRYLLHQCGERGLAEDLYQDIWMKLIAAREHYEIHAKFSTWLFTIAHRRLIDHYRRSSARPQEAAPWPDEDEPGDPLDAYPGPEALEPQRQALTAELRTGLLAALAGLPAAQREAFLLVEEGDLSLEDAARVAGVGRETLKSRLRYALGKLRAALVEYKS